MSSPMVGVPLVMMPILVGLAYVATLHFPFPGLRLPMAGVRTVLLLLSSSLLEGGILGVFTYYKMFSTYFAIVLEEKKSILLGFFCVLGRITHFAIFTVGEIIF